MKVQETTGCDSKRWQQQDSNSKDVTGWHATNRNIVGGVNTV